VEFEELVAVAKCRPAISDNGVGDLALCIGFLQVNYGISAAFISVASGIWYKSTLVRRSDYA
jgi:hypothetical protein